MKVVEIQIRLEAIGSYSPTRWRVEVSSTTNDPLAKVQVEALNDRDLAEIADLPPGVCCWADLLRHFSPNSVWQPGLAVLKAVGGLIWKRILGQPAIRRRLEEIERKVQTLNGQLRYVIELDEGEESLKEEHIPSISLLALPLELAFDSQRFVFKHRRYPAIRCRPDTEARNLSLLAGARVLIATAHADGRRPKRDELSQHAQAISKAAARIGWKPSVMQDVTPSALRDALLTGAQVDVLYVACHGEQDRDHAGRLLLREGTLTGVELGKVLEAVAEEGRPVQVVILCACSSAVPESGQDTSGMAQWLAGPNRALAALGFRGAVEVSWAMQFTEQIFSLLARGTPLEMAFAQARWDQPDDRPQWVLPLLYAPRSDPFSLHEEIRREDASRPELSVNSAEGGLTRGPILPPTNGDGPDWETLLATLNHLGAVSPGSRSSEQLGALTKPFSNLPRQGRPYFTGRAYELEMIQRRINTTATGSTIVLVGEGGIGKSELALQVAWRFRESGRRVLWLERPDRDPRSAVITLICMVEPGFQASPHAKVEDLSLYIKRLLSSYSGILVLDDVFDGSAIDLLIPSDSCHVLVTTRTRLLIPEAEEIHVQPLELEAALTLLARVTWNSDVPPDHMLKQAVNLIVSLCAVPLAIELAGSTLRRAFITPSEYLESLHRGAGAASDDLNLLRQILMKSLAALDESDRVVFMLLGIFPVVGVKPEQVALALKETEPKVANRLVRLSRYSLVQHLPESGRYRLHELLWEAAREMAEQNAELWNKLHDGVGKTLATLGRWMKEPLTYNFDAGLARWKDVRDQFDSLTTTGWERGAPGGDCIASALMDADTYRQFDCDWAKRAAHLSAAARLSHGADPLLRARHIVINSELKRFAGDPASLERELTEALHIFQQLGHHGSQAEAHMQLGGFYEFQGQNLRALAELELALILFSDHDDKLGQSNVLLKRGDLLFRQGDLEGAQNDFGRALTLYRQINHRLGSANVLHSRASLRQRTGDLSEAATDYDESLALLREIGDRLGEADTLVAQGDLRLMMGDLERGAQDLDQAVSMFRQLKATLGMANALLSRGLFRCNRGALREAEQDLREALTLNTEMKSTLGVANTYRALGKLMVFRNEVANAQDCYLRATELYESISDIHNQPVALAELGMLLVLTGHPQPGCRFAERAVALARQVGNPIIEAQAQEVLKRASTLEELSLTKEDS